MDIIELFFFFYFIHGASGTGKTLYAYKLAERLNQRPYIKKCSGAWQNYDRQKVVYIENLRKDQIPILRHNPTRGASTVCVAVEWLY